MIVVDQLPSWVFGPRASSFTGGLRRLLDGGIYAPSVQLPYGTPFTAPGHATLATGAPPAVHGIIGNSWYRRDVAGEGGQKLEAMVDADFDPASPIFRVAAPPPSATSPAAGSPEAAVGARIDPGVSAVALRVPGLAEALRQGTGGRGISVAVGLKARAACFVAGQRPDDVVFFEPDAGGMTTSAAYAAAVPRWLVAHAAAAPMARWLDAEWAPADAGRLAAVTKISDGAAGEGAEHHLGTTFPHRLAETTSPGHAIALTPFGDRMVLETARAAIAARQLGADAIPDLLAISLNSHDFAGHSWGPGSWEEVELLWRLDVELGAFFAFLDKTVGADRYAVVLTSDHGVTPLVERSGIAGARRIPPAEVIAAAETALDASWGPGEWVASFASANLYLSAAARQQPKEKLARGLAAAEASIREIPGIAAAGRYEPIIDDDAGSCERTDPLEQSMCLAAAPDARGELYVVAHPGSVISPYVTGTHHDAPSEHNRVVPLLVMGPGIAPRTETGALTTLAVAPTVARLLGVAPPEAAKARPLSLDAPPR
jgi:Type I phosphodiesterase / nucleotide pyrophosphatase